MGLRDLLLSSPPRTKCTSNCGDRCGNIHIKRLAWLGCTMLLLVMMPRVRVGYAPRQADDVGVGVQHSERTQRSLRASIDQQLALFRDAPAPQRQPQPNTTQMCSPEFKAQNTRRVDSGGDPLLVQWGCQGIENCPAAKVGRLVESYRKRKWGDFLHLVPCDLFSLIRGRTLWIIGDSQQQYFYRQLRCFLSGFRAEGSASDAPITEDPAELQSLESTLLGSCSGWWACDGSNIVDGIAQAPTPAAAQPRPCRGNTCCCMGVPMCMQLQGGTRVCHARVNVLSHFLDHYLPNLGSLNMTTDDIVVLNFGLWHPNGAQGQYAALLQRLADHYTARREQLPTLIWRDTSVQHFKGSKTGEFQGGAGGYMQCGPIQDAKLLPDGRLRVKGDKHDIERGGWRNVHAKRLLKARNMPYLETWNETAMLHDMHKAGECSHFCAPGGYSVWVARLWRLLSELQLSPPMAAAAGDASRPR